MRVLVVSHTYVEPENRKKLHALAAEGLEVRVAVPARWHERALDRTWITAPTVEHGVRVVPVDVYRPLGSPAAAWWRALPSLDDVDLLHVEEEPWSLVAAVAIGRARRRGIPTTIFTWQNLAHHPRWPLSALRRRTLLAADGWMAGNRQAAALLKRLDDLRPTTVVPQLGVDPPAPFVPSCTDGPLRVGFVGRLVPGKGVGDLLGAMGRLPDGVATLTVIGSGPERERLERMVGEHRWEDRVTFAGTVAHGEMASRWQDLDVLVLPSRTTGTWAEQFGHVLIEAMAAGVAVIGSDSGAIPEVIGEGGTVVPERSPEALAAALRPLTDRAVLTQRQAAAHRRASAFTHAALARRYRRFWEQCT